MLETHADACLLSKDVKCDKSKLPYHRLVARLGAVSEACRYHGAGGSFRRCKCSRTCRLNVRFHSCTLLPWLASSICLIPTVPQPLASLRDGPADLDWTECGAVLPQSPTPSLLSAHWLGVPDAQYLRYVAKVSRALTNQEIFHDIFEWDNTEEVTLWYMAKQPVSSTSADLLSHQNNKVKLSK